MSLRPFGLACIRALTAVAVIMQAHSACSSGPCRQQCERYQARPPDNSPAGHSVSGCCQQTAHRIGPALSAPLKHSVATDTAVQCRACRHGQTRAACTCLCCRHTAPALVLEPIRQVELVCKVIQTAAATGPAIWPHRATELRIWFSSERPETPLNWPCPIHVICCVWLT